MRSQPRAIMVEFYPDLVEGMGFPGGAQRIFDMLTSWGYAQAQHMGQVSALNLISCVCCAKTFAVVGSIWSLICCRAVYPGLAVSCFTIWRQQTRGYRVCCRRQHSDLLAVSVLLGTSAWSNGLRAYDYGSPSRTSLTRMQSSNQAGVVYRLAALPS